MMIYCLSIVMGVSSSWGSDPTKSANWSFFNGNGSFCPPVENRQLIKDLGKAKLVWQSDIHMGVGKTNAKDEGMFYGGCASPIAADGKVFINFYRPSGDVLNEKTFDRYYGTLDVQPKTMRQVNADDVTVAFDAKTGKILWKAEEVGKGVNFLPSKRGHHGVTSAYADGTVFVWGALGMIYAYDAESGRKKWESPAEGFYNAAKKIKDAGMEKKATVPVGHKGLWYKLMAGMIVVDGILIAPGPERGLMGIDTKNGKTKWKLPKSCDRTTTPAIVHLKGKNYILCGTEGGTKDGRTIGKVSLVDPSNGKVLWKDHPGGPVHASLVVENDIVLMNVRGNLSSGPKGPRGDVRLGSGLLAAFRISPEGMEKLWQMEDVPENYYAIRPDRGQMRRIAIRDNKAYILLPKEGAPKARHIRVYDLPTGKILGETKESLHSASSGLIPVENRLLVFPDSTHSWGKLKLNMYDLSKGEDEMRAAGELLFPSMGVFVVTAYLVGNEYPYYDGRLYLKTLKGIACVDLGK